MKKAKITPEMLDAAGDTGWKQAAMRAGIGPKDEAWVPSETTRAQLRQRFADAIKRQQRRKAR